jgi:hypothetical protein
MSLVAIVLVHGLIVAAPLTRMIRERSVINPRPCQCSFLGRLCPRDRAPLNLDVRT